MPRWSHCESWSALGSTSSLTARSGGRATPTVSPRPSRMDVINPGTAIDRTGHPNPVPRVVGPVRRNRPVLLRDARFL